MYRGLLIAVCSILFMALLAVGCRGPIEIEPPDGWSESENPPSGALTVFYNPEPDFHGELSFSATISIAEESVPDLTLEEYVESSKRLVPSLVADFEVVEESVSEVDGLPAYFIGTEFSHGPLTYRSRQLCVASDSRFYVVTAMSLESQWHKYEDDFDRSLRSFRP